ncbi:MAG: TonB-dependent receptor [Bacteroidales bacterium]|nr:TonB-dependent receptor [Bacteroidales bacterium]
MLIRFSSICFSLLIANISIFAQSLLTGYVYEKVTVANQKKFVPLVGANVYWKDTQIGTTTNEKGQFKIKKTNSSNILIVSFVGYKSDTLRIPEDQKDINIVLESIEILNEVNVEARQKGEHIDKMNPIKTEIITTTGLQKLACCNLSESFENSGTVDVNYSDAITGAKQIQMLGLAGIYSQLLGENMPLNNYLSYSHGLTYIPGTWMQSIQVSKGTASVINGFESITGQINVDFKKPHLSDLLFANIYTNSEGRIELNTDVNFHLNENLSAGTLVHAENQMLKNDHNNDGFLDIPLNKQINIFQRFNYEKEDKLCFQYGVKLLYDDKIGGQKSFNSLQSHESQSAYGVGITNKRYELLTKHGFILPRHSTSIGLQISGTYHQQDAFFGHNTFKAEEKYLYMNTIFNTYLINDDNKIDVGSSFISSHINQNINIPGLDTLSNFKNNVPGAFAQYSFHYQRIFSIIAGFRADYSTLFKSWIYTPRLHVKYDISEHTTVRASGGKGSRFSIPVSENTNFLASSRVWFLQYDKYLEDAWNYGISYTQRIEIVEGKHIQLVADYYHTTFNRQLIIDNISDPLKIQIYPLQGKSYSRSYQLNVNMNIIKSLEATIIGRYNDVRMTYSDGILKVKPLVVPFKLLGSFSYSTMHDKWSFDVTVQWNSRMSLPNMSLNPYATHISSKSDAYTVLHAQITRRFKKFDIYIGGENLLNYKLHHPIIAYEDPFSNYFDATLIYAPIMGRMYYIGLRYKIKNK